MTPVGRSPTRFSSAVSVILAGIAVASSGLYSWPAVTAGILGTVVLLAGVITGVRSAVTVGSAGLYVGVLVAGAQGAPVIAVLVGAVATVLAWDMGTAAISLGRQLGRAAGTIRLEVVHLVASGGVGALTVAAGSLVYQHATGGQPVSAVILLVVATVLLLTAVIPDADRPSEG